MTKTAKNRAKKIILIVLSVLLLWAIINWVPAEWLQELLPQYFIPENNYTGPEGDITVAVPHNIPAASELVGYKGESVKYLNGNIPTFSEEEKNENRSYEYYSTLDSLGRCGYCVACIGKDLMPTEPREEIGSVKPSGWQSVKYDCVDGKYLYNRCHLIGFQLTAENANNRNLITGTRYLNVVTMLPFENMVADYIKETGNHVLYMVIPIFDGNNLVAGGVIMMGWSVEDAGDGICYNAYLPNIQPGVTIDYANGKSKLS